MRLLERRVSTHFYCHHCKANRAFSKRVPDHRAHGILTAVTLGVWSVVWVSATLRRSGGRWRCGWCSIPQPLTPPEGLAGAGWELFTLNGSENLRKSSDGVSGAKPAAASSDEDQEALRFLRDLFPRES